MNFIEIGERIRHIRKNKLKLKRDEFAELLDSNISSIGRLERGEIKILDVELLSKISKESGYSIDEIVNGFSDNNKEDIIQKINYLLNDLTKEQLNYEFENIHKFTKLMDSDINTFKKRIPEKHKA